MKRALVCVVAPAALVGSVASAALLPAVLPMDARIYRDQASQSLAIRFAGRVPASRAQRVTLLVRECSSRFYRQIGATTSIGAGTWEMTVGGGYGFPMAPSGSTYRARWNGRFTVPFAWRTQLVPGVTKLSGSRFRVTVYTGYASPLQDLRGRSVILQRLSDGRYVDVRSAVLRLVDARTFTTTFAVPTRGLTLRVLAPTKTTRPCYNAGASAVFQS